MGGPNHETPKTDSTSFASILAGVKRMREQYGGEVTSAQNESASSNEPTSSTTTERQTTIERPEKRTRIEPASTEVSARPELTESPQITYVRRTLHEPTAQVKAPSTAPVRANTTGPVARPAGRFVAPSEILINKSQTGNPLLKESLMKVTPWKFDSTILSDYYINPGLQFLFLSLKYHKLRPEYIWQRLKKINKGASSSNTRNDRSLRILLTVVDIDSHQEILRSLLDLCIKNDLTLVLAWSFEEAGNYIVFAKQQDNVPSKTQGIKGIKAVDYNSNVVEAMTGIRLINKTDVSNLLANCKSVKNIVLQSSGGEDLVSIGGLGSTKIRDLKRVFLEPFIYNKQYD
ncbi:DNA repair protein rad10 [Suhomyces tanzawaensis NRRL Y-17324]|uniref:DNA repair protein rad10 n=1 Tax=Suhomyces tanzawaensis NRRL Y-17324 TaxID=984487 RepID=A0A1E4SPF0_9ASCO|nr:DNA repair protein rad10 [Suhomyces tanzawaensis NRRL Y-17324]ODV81404.1 DNA repair protein rad10 [Suhomyces tanzawaensis NRRL Y-17324]